MVYPSLSVEVEMETGMEMVVGVHWIVHKWLSSIREVQHAVFILPDMAGKLAILPLRYEIKGNWYL